MPPAQTNRYLDPAALGRLKNLGLAARTAVEGFFSGMHRSPDKGFSIEFAEHREYAPGMDPRHVDWRVLGRRDKLYVKQYEEETSLRLHLVLDTSASMAYRSDAAPMTKLDYACYLAASFAYLASTQHDAAGLVTVDSAERDRIPPKQGPGHLRAIMHGLETAKPGGETALGPVLHRLAGTFGRRAMVVVISDLLDDPDAIIAGLKHFRHNKHEVLVLQVLDPAEVHFPFDDVSRIQDMETGREVLCDPAAFRVEYLETFGRFLETIRGGCRSARIDYAAAETGERFDGFLGAYLARRQRMKA